jgi:hypothetical protein
MDDPVLGIYTAIGCLTGTDGLSVPSQVDSFCQFFYQKQPIIAQTKRRAEMESETHAPQQTAKRKTWIVLAAGGALALLCVCLVAAAFLVLPAVANIGQSTVSYEGNADEQLKTDTLQLIAQYEQAQGGCNDVTLFIGNMMTRPEQTEDGSWSEMWQVNACGESHLYSITFTPDGVGGTYISASRIDP